MIWLSILIFLTPNFRLRATAQSKNHLELEFVVQNPKDMSPIGGLLAIPEGGIRTVRFIPTDSTRLDFKAAEPENLKIGRPMIFRDLRVAPIIIKPWRKGWVYTRGRVQLEFEGGDFLVHRDRPLSATFLPIYESTVLNFTQVKLEIRSVRRGSYLIIAHDSLAQDVEQLAEWRCRTGYHVRVVRLSEIAPNPLAEDIRAYIMNAYETWDYPPDFVVLIGDNYMPFGTFPYFTYQDAPDDAYFGMLEGDDYLPEVMVGRISVDSRQELRTVIAKTIAYESEPLRDGAQWLKKALMVAGVYIRTDTVNTTKLTKLRIRDDLLASGFQVDTVFWNITSGGTYTDILNSVNNGVGLVNYRGWSNSGGWVYPVFYTTHIPMLNNGFKLPVVFSISCGTGNFVSPTDPCFGEAWIRVGTPENPSGAVAFVGPSDPFTHTKWNNAIDIGMFWGMLHEDLADFRAIVTRGLLQLIPSFPDHAAPGDEVEFYFHVYTVLGDPALKVWTDIPQPIEADFSHNLVIGNNLFELETGEPVENGYVSLVMNHELLSAGPLNERGEFLTDVQIDNEGWLVVTVTGRNRIPFMDSVYVSRSDVMLTVGSAEWNELLGNGDGHVNPGERFEVIPNFANTGTSTASNITAVLRSRTGFASVIDSISNLTELPGGGTASGDAFLVQFDEFLPDGQAILFEVEIRSAQWTYRSLISAEAYSGVPWVDSVAFVDDDGDGYLEPGENSQLTIKIVNRGREELRNLRILLSTNTDALDVLDSTVVVGDLSAGNSADITGFSIHAESGAAYGRSFSLRFKFLSNSVSYGTQAVWKSIGEPLPEAPLGPDPYGYWLYEDIDNSYPETPIFHWIELDPDYGGNGTPLDFGPNELAYIDLPFTFRFYGVDYDRITVSLNGWLAFDSTDLFYYRNWPIPGPLSPERLVAPFWDDLVGGNVFTSYNSELHAFVIEWSRVRNKFDNSTQETFEVLLFDPQHHPTLTGDGEIVLQYLQIADIDSLENYSTIGIESHDRTVGLQYLYAHRNAPFTEPLRPNKALKFTTDPPDSFIFDVGENEPIRTSGSLSVLRIVNSDLTIKLAEVHPSIQLHAKIYDVSGKLLMSNVITPKAKTVRLDLRKLPAGVYVLRVKYGEIGGTFKFVKVR